MPAEMGTVDFSVKMLHSTAVSIIFSRTWIISFALQVSDKPKSEWVWL